MSLINDALKRARNKVQGANASVSDPAAPMQPVDQRRPGLPVYFMPVLLFIIAGACYFIIKGWEGKRQAGFYPQPVTIQARELESLKPQTAGVAEKEYPIPTNRNFSLNGDSPSAAAHGDAEVTQPSFKLQGIFYKANSPSAVINSKTVFVGDTIANAKVQAIGRQSVTLLCNGETKVLTLP